MSIKKKLYVEFRVIVPADSNQESLDDMAKQMQEHIHDEWNGTLDMDGEPNIQCTDVTYELVMETNVSEDELEKN